MLVPDAGAAALGGAMDGQLTAATTGGRVTIVDVATGRSTGVRAHGAPVGRTSLADGGGDAGPGGILLAPGGRVTAPGLLRRLDPVSRVTTRLSEMLP